MQHPLSIQSYFNPSLLCKCIRLLQDIKLQIYDHSELEVKIQTIFDHDICHDLKNLCWQLLNQSQNAQDSKIQYDSKM